MMLIPALSGAQEIGQQALSTFPADTQQLAVADLTQLRASPEYAQVRQRLLNFQMRSFEDFLHSAGMDPDKDVDTVVMGWRGPGNDASRVFGIAQGRFQQDQVHNFFTRSKLPIRQYAGQDLYAYGSGEDSDDLFFAFLNSSLGAFGRLSDLKALLDVWAGNATPLSSNTAISNWEGELEGSAPQWGIVTGAAAANLAAPLLAGSGKTNPGALFAPVRAVLYRVTWDSGFSAKLSVVCRDSQSAGALTQLLTLLHNAQVQPAGNTSATSPLAFLQALDITQENDRVELSGTGSIDALAQALRGTPPEKAPATPAQ